MLHTSLYRVHCHGSVVAPTIMHASAMHKDNSAKYESMLISWLHATKITMYSLIDYFFFFYCVCYIIIEVIIVMLIETKIFNGRCCFFNYVWVYSY